MPATPDDINNLNQDARAAVLSAIIDLAPRAKTYGGGPMHLAQMAEAYAWLTYPNQAHGGSTVPSS